MGWKYIRKTNIIRRNRMSKIKNKCSTSKSTFICQKLLWSHFLCSIKIFSYRKPWLVHQLIKPIIHACLYETSREILSVESYPRKAAKTFLLYYDLTVWAISIRYHQKNILWKYLQWYAHKNLMDNLRYTKWVINH